MLGNVWRKTIGNLLEAFSGKSRLFCKVKHRKYRVLSFFCLLRDGISLSTTGRCIKLTNDPPSGLRANLKQAFASISREEHADLEPRYVVKYFVNGFNCLIPRLFG